MFKKKEIVNMEPNPQMQAKMAGLQPSPTGLEGDSQLLQWPVQIKLAPVQAPFYQGCKLLIAADCTAFSHGNFHEEFIKDHVTLIGCPKLDEGDYSEKLTEIIKSNDIKEVHLVRMEVPCCGGLERVMDQVFDRCSKEVPFKVTILTTGGKIQEVSL